MIGFPVNGYHFQKDAMTLDEMKKVLGQLPSRIGNAIVSAALPSIASTISHTLAHQLLQGLPAEFLANQSNGPAPNSLAPHPSALAPNSPPGSNGFLPAQSSEESPSPATRPTPLATHSHPTYHGNSTAHSKGEAPVASPRAPRHAPLATRSPVSNGKSKTASRKKNARKLARKQWLGPLAKKCQAAKKPIRQRVIA
jgi:hypothetical protein